MRASLSGRLEGRVALVTGAGQGIGRAFARRFASEGASVGVVDINLDGAEETASLLSRDGHRATAVEANVGDPESVANGVKAVEAKFGPIGILANVAGIYGRHDLIRDQDLANWNRVLGINLTGTFLCSKAVLPSMLAAGWGRIINISSSQGLRPRTRVGPYVASKAAVIGFTKAFALEVARSGVTVNALVPSVVDTAMPRENSSEERLREQAQENPSGRIGQPEDLAALAAFLASDDAAYITGQAIAVNGGQIQLP
ncbi:MAG TPA: SDR family NAD(P)-dependent oxidoreductase [Chloroflexota bacterium]|nr:SDR family NAD(P)-dependent oxidoreductase [Chloroflexota bacterium]